MKPFIFIFGVPILCIIIALLTGCGIEHEGHYSIEERGFNRGVAHVKCDGDTKLCHKRQCEKRAGDFMAHCWREWVPCE